MAWDTDKIKEDAGTLWDTTLPGKVSKGITGIAGAISDKELSKFTDLDPNPASRAFWKLVKMLMERYNIPQTQAERIARNQMADANVLPEGPGTADEGYRPEIGIDAGAEDPWDIPEQETSEITREDIREWLKKNRDEWPKRFPDDNRLPPSDWRKSFPEYKKEPFNLWGPPAEYRREPFRPGEGGEFEYAFNKGGRAGYQTGGITETRNLPPEYIEALGKTYAADLTRQAGIPSITTAQAQQPGETAQQWQQRQAQAQQFGITKAGMADLAPTVAAQDPYQAAAYAQAVDPTTGLGAYQPYLATAGQAATAAGALTGPMTAAQTTAYMSPYQQQVIDASLADYDAQAAKSRLGLGAQAVAGGAYGAGRHGIAEAEFDVLSNRGRGTLQSGLRQRGFEQAQQARQQDLANQMGLVNLQTGLGQTAQDFGRAQIAGLGTLGAGQQAQNQAVLDAQRQTAQMAVQDPINRLNLLGSGVTGLMGGMGATGTTIAEAPASAGSSPLATALGVGLAGADIYSRLQPRITKTISG